MNVLTGYLLMHTAVRAETARLDEFAQGLAAGRRHAGPRQLTALRAHLRRVSDTVRRHHAAEDEHLWPLLRGYVPGITAPDGHGGFDALMDAVDLTLGLLADQPADEELRRVLARTAGELHRAMTVHLDAEEAVVRPAVTDHVPAEHYVRTEHTMRRSARLRTSFVLPWTAAADPVLFARLPQAATAPTRLLLALTRGRHAQSVADAYGDLAPRATPIVLCAEVEQFVPAPPEEVYAVVADVPRMAEHSPECVRCEWVDEAPGPLPGARFQGWSNDRGMRWARDCVVLVTDAGREFTYRTVPAGAKRDSTVWSFRLEPVEGGTIVRQSFELTAGPFMQWFERVTHRETRTPLGMRHTLRRLAESFTTPSGTADAPEPAPESTPVTR